VWGIHWTTWRFSYGQSVKGLLMSLLALPPYYTRAIDTIPQP